MAVIEITVYNSPNIDEAIAESVLNLLGLKTAQIRQEFYSSYSYQNLTEFFKKVINAPKNAGVFANIAKKLKKNGKMQISFEVDDKVLSDVREFLAVRENKLKNRIIDSDDEKARANVNAVVGAVQNITEGQGDIARGIKQGINGLFNSAITPVGSEKFREGVRDVRDGARQILRGQGKMYIQTPADFAAMLLLGGADSLQTLVGLENIGCSLNYAEVRLLQSIFGHSVVLEIIKIKEGYAGIYNLGEDRDAQNNTTYLDNQRALTRGNTIYMKSNIPGSNLWNSTLVHEITHVWQNQNGGTDYMSEALYAQIFGDGYDYADAITATVKLVCYESFLKICDVWRKNWMNPMSAPKATPPTIPHGEVPQTRSKNQPIIIINATAPKSVIAAEKASPVRLMVSLCFSN